MGKEIKGQKNHKEKNIEDITAFAVLKSNSKSPQHYFILCKPEYYYIGGIWGRKTNVF